MGPPGATSGTQYNGDPGLRSKRCCLLRHQSIISRPQSHVVYGLVGVVCFTLRRPCGSTNFPRRGLSCHVNQKDKCPPEPGPALFSSKRICGRFVALLCRRTDPYHRQTRRPFMRTCNTPSSTTQERIPSLQFSLHTTVSFFGTFPSQLRSRSIRTLLPVNTLPDTPLTVASFTFTY